VRNRRADAIRSKARSRTGSEGEDPADPRIPGEADCVDELTNGAFFKKTKRTAKAQRTQRGKKRGRVGEYARVRPPYILCGVIHASPKLWGERSSDWPTARPPLPLPACLNLFLVPG